MSIYGTCNLCNSDLIYSQAAEKFFGNFYNCSQCKKYAIEVNIENAIMDPRDDIAKYRSILAGYLLERRDRKNPISIRNQDDLDRIINDPSVPKTITEKKNKLLKYISLSGNIGEIVEVPFAAAYAENDSELMALIKDLEKKSYIKNYSDDGGYGAEITVEGIEYLESSSNINDSKNCFVAMWFSDLMESAFNNSIYPACGENGYLAQKINDTHFNGDIMEKIHSQINKCRFVIADLTGYRGGVYYEAGYARGLGKEVIFTCKEDWYNKLVLEEVDTYKNKKKVNSEKRFVEELREVHFDLSHMNTIMWVDELDLKKKLFERIQLTIGVGVK